jgi:uncharacterized membrane protein
MASVARFESVVMLVCITTGAVIGFSATGSAAFGSAIGAAAGMGAIALARRRTSTQGR